MRKKTKMLLKTWSRLKKDRKYFFSTKDNISLDDTPAYPLARTVAMPDGYSYEAGAVSFKLYDMSLSSIRTTKTSVVEKQSRTIISLVLDKMELKGNYSVDVKPDPIAKIDTAGNLMEITPETSPGKAGADADSGQASLDPQQEAWLDQARDQRTRLSGTSNGQKLMGVYNQHNEVYNDVFKNSSAMQTTWKSGGVTKSMAADTSDALKTTDSVINDGSKKYKNADTGEEVSYNANAFKQQIALCFNTIFQDPGYNPFDAGSLPQGKYLDAAKATLSFAKVVQTTGNDKKNVKPMTQNSVYSSVDVFSGSMPEVSDTEVNDLMNQGQGAGGRDSHGDLGWTVLDEEDRAMLQALFQKNLGERAENAKITGTSMFKGQCHGTLSETRAEIIEESDGGISVNVEIPAFDLVIDDDLWHGTVGEVTRQRLESTYFIRGLLSEALRNSLASHLLAAVKDKSAAKISG